MSYVLPGDDFSDDGDDDLSASTIAESFEDDEESSEGGAEDLLRADLREPAANRSLQGDAATVERPLTAGIHIWPGVKEALEHTFQGWPDSSEYAAFCKRAREVLQKDKNKRVRDSEEFGLQTSLIPEIDKHVQKFLRFNGNPIGKPGQRLNNYKSVLKIMAKGVKYLSVDMRQKYQVTLGPQLTRGGDVFCTSTLFDRKKRTAMPGSQLNSKIEGKRKRCIWVMAEGPNGEVVCYSHFGKIGAFHHSSFTGGEGVLAAGEWYVENGICTLINGLSGHYKPESWRLLRALKIFSAKGVLRPETEIQVFTKFYPAGDEVRLPAIEFMGNWSARMNEYSLFPA